MTDKLTPEFRVIKHWAEFGQRGGEPSSRVHGSERETSAFETPVISNWNVTIPRNDLPKLINGFRPRAMEDKWFIYSEGPDEQGILLVHMFRSWTGYKMVELKVKVPLAKDGAFEEQDSELFEITWESNENRYNDSTEKSAKDMAKELCNWVLDVALVH